MNIRKQISKFLISIIHQNGKVPSGDLRRQVEEDPELYRHWKSEQELTEALRSEPEEQVSVPSDLRAKILARVETETAKPSPTWYLQTHVWQMTAIAAILVFGTMLLVLNDQAPQSVQNPEPPVIEHIIEQPGAPITLESPIENHPLVQLSAIIESPLRNEPERLLNDAENALRFLSKNFIPSEAWREEVKEKYFGS